MSFKLKCDISVKSVRFSLNPYVLCDYILRLLSGSLCLRSSRVRCRMMLALTFKSMYYVFLLLPICQLRWKAMLYHWEYIVLKASPEGRSEQKKEKGEKQVVKSFSVSIELFDGILPLSLTWNLINVCCVSVFKEERARSFLTALFMGIALRRLLI